MRDLKAHLTFRNRANDALLCETISYFIPDCGDHVRLRLVSKEFLDCWIYERLFMFDENRVVLFVTLKGSV